MYKKIQWVFVYLIMLLCLGLLFPWQQVQALVATGASKGTTTAQSPRYTSGYTNIKMLTLSTNQVDPEISLGPVVSTVVTGATLTLQVTTTTTESSLSYEWYSNATSTTTGGALIAQAGASTYTVPTTNTGITYYYCVVTATSPSQGAAPVQLTSNSVSVTVTAVPPQLTYSTLVQRSTSTTATISFTSSKAGTYYYLVLPSSDTAPTVEMIKAQNASTGIARGTGQAKSGSNAINVSGMDGSTEYKAYVLVEEPVNNPSAIAVMHIPTTLPTTLFTSATTAADLVNGLIADPNISLAENTVISTGSLGAASLFTNLYLGVMNGVEYTLPNGVLVTTGNGTPPLTNTSNSYGVNNGQGSDTHVETYAGVSGSRDAFSLQFNFTVPVGTSAIEFMYMFGSEEYPVYIGKISDGAVVIVDGVNYAKFDNGTPLKVVAEADMKDNVGLGIEYNGISQPKKIVALLDPHLTTHSLKIAIADTSDQVYDSGLFLAGMKTSAATQGGIVNAATPMITNQPQDITVTVGSPASLSVTASLPTTTSALSYKWYSNTTAAAIGGMLISEATTNAYIAPTTTAGITYYYCVVTNVEGTATGNITASATTRAAKVTIVPPAPTGAVYNDSINTFNWTLVPGYSANSDYEYTKDGGQIWRDLPEAASPLYIGNVNLEAGRLQVRVKENLSLGRPAGAVLVSNTAFTLSPMPPYTILASKVGDLVVNAAVTREDPQTAGVIVFELMRKRSGLESEPVQIQTLPAVETLGPHDYQAVFAGLASDSSYSVKVFVLDRLDATTDSAPQSLAAPQSVLLKEQANGLDNAQMN